MSTQVKERINEAITKHALTVESVFIPWSLSRNAGEKNPSLNWKVTLKHNGRKVLTTDYGAGMGHAPSCKQWDNSIDGHNAVENECEGGKSRITRKPILPDARDVIYSLLQDSEVLNHDSFESWASDYGYDEDSRSAEKTYQACIKIALQFRTIGESAIDELRDAFQDY